MFDSIEPRGRWEISEIADERCTGVKGCGQKNLKQFLGLPLKVTQCQHPDVYSKPVPSSRPNQFLCITCLNS